PRDNCQLLSMCTLFFFSSRRRHTRSKRDWSSDVCSSDLTRPLKPRRKDRAHKKTPPKRGFPNHRSGSDSGRNYVGCLGALGAVLNVKGHFLTFGKGLETAALDSGEMDENVLAAVILADESEALALVEPLD